MYPGSDNQLEQSMYENIPNASLAFTMYTTTFGNGSFMIQPPMPNQIGDGFPTIPYLSLEAVLYEAQSSNPWSAPLTTYSGSNTGQQVISSTQTANDETGTPRSLTGTQNTT
jgi:hypothetical protein